MATKPLGFHKSSLGKRGHGSPRKAWSECAREDLDAFKLKPSDAQDRVGLEILCEKNSQMESTLLCGRHLLE